MIIVMEPHAPEEAIESVVGHLIGAGFSVHRSSGTTRTILGAVGEPHEAGIAVLRELPFVAEVVRVSEPYPDVAREPGQPTMVVEGPWGRIGGGAPWIAIEPVPSASGAPAARPAEKLAFDAVVVRGADAPPTM